MLLGRSESDLAEVAVTIRGFGREAEVLICDLLHPSGLSELIARLGRIDILVNNSGMNIPEPFVTVTESHYDQIFGLNMRALFFVNQSVVDSTEDSGWPSGTAGDVAPAVVFLCSEAAALITGSSVKVDGGWTAQS